MSSKIKSKFKFPVPGRSSKKQEVPPVSVSSTLSKAQRILGADGINTGSSKPAADSGRAWETGSTCGISISISESSTSQSTNDTGFDWIDGDDSVGTSYGRALWEQESEIIPRQLRSAHGPARKGLTTKRSVYTVGNESRDHVTDVSTSGRRLSTSTIDTHYDPAKMPLAISQQTSSSAMAKGVPTKVNMLLDMDGTLAGAQPRKKKPAKLDLSLLRPRAHRDRNRTAAHGEPIPGSSYIIESPSLASQLSGSPMHSASTTESHQKSSRKLTKQQPAMQGLQAKRPSTWSRGLADATGLRQLYHHYEQTSFRDEQALEEEEDKAHIPDHLASSIDNQRLPNTFTHDLISPLPLPFAPGHGTNWGHLRNNSHDSKITVSTAETSMVFQSRSILKKEYAGSISSRHTRTSKASPSSKSALESDRQQSSVLSLSDSSDDEAVGPAQAAPPTRENLAPVAYNATLEHPDSGFGYQNSSHPHGTSCTRRFKPSLNRLNEDSTVDRAHKLQNGRLPPNDTLHSNHSSLSTLTPVHYLPPSAPDSRLYTRSYETLDMVESPHQSGYGVQEAKAVSFIPLASTVEAASKVSTSENPNHLDKYLLRQNSSATSRFSQSSDQPTPPLSPNSVEFYVKSRESLQRDAMINGSSEAHNARLMAVTRQEEMLLAALRQKRAKMRGNIISEAEEDKGNRISRSNRSSFGSGKRSNSTINSKGMPERLAVPGHHTSSKTKAWPKRGSSLFMGSSRENLRIDDEQNILRKKAPVIDTPSATSRSHATEWTPPSVPASTSITTFDSRHERVLLYLDRPTRDTNAVDTYEPSPDISDYIDDSDGGDLVVNERRTSRMQSQRDGSSGTASGRSRGSTSSRRESSNHSNERRKDAIPISPLSAPNKGHQLQDVPEVNLGPERSEDVGPGDLDDDSIDDFTQPPMPPPSWPLPPKPERPISKPDSPISSGLLHPSTAIQGHSPERTPSHVKSKRSMVRLSAVGGVNSPVPWWGDDD
ncbi:hypothetical protein F5Y19DRAFT_13803 [Xylariaceae sp. FL1651]|nr:hypothetical protein F5Y19DRAFT_13803 [Xylariaceae sp. FL1651]